MLANRHLERGLGPLRIRADLERAGVDRELVAAILSALEPGAVEAAARTALGSRTGAAGAGRLARRGFDEDLIERLGLRPDI